MRRLAPPAAATALVACLCRLSGAQEATAWVDLIVVRNGSPLEQATVGLSGAAMRSATTDRRGAAAFPHLRPGRYLVSANAQAARPEAPSLVVRAGDHLRVRVEFSSSETAPMTITVIGHVKPGATDFSTDDLGAIPRSSDAWSVLRDVPGVLLDRVNVGGSDTAVQSLLVYRGDAGTGAVWSIDGVDVTDPAAVGSTAIYPDLDAVEEVDARSGASDVRVRTPGVQIGLHLRDAGGFSGSVHARGALDALQSDNLPAGLAGHTLFRNRTDRLLELAAEAGGPVHEGKLWLWGAASRTALRQDTFTGHDDELRLLSFIGKGRLLLGGGSLSLLALRTEKIDQDRDTGLSAAPEARWRQSGPAHLVALEDRHGWGGLSWLARASFLDGGFRLEPHGAASASPYEDFRGIFRGSYSRLDTTRRRLEAGLETAGRRRWIGLDHEFVAGAHLRLSPVETRFGWPGNGILAFERQNVFFRTFQLSGFALPTREQHARTRTSEAGVYAQDALRAGRLGLTLGARLDRLTGRNLSSAVAANPVFPDLLPAVAYAGAPPRFRWLDLLPRAALSWDIKPGRLIARASYAAYGAPLGSGEITFDSPVGRESASLTYYWIDRNGDHAVQRGELDTLRGLLATSGVLGDAPASTVSPHRIDPNLRSPRTHELTLGVERRAGGLQATLAGVWRRQVHPLWAPLQGLTLADYAARGSVDGELFADRYSVVFYAPASASRIAPGDGRLLTNREGYRQDVFAAEADLHGRWRRRLRWRAWGTLSDWREFFVDNRAIQDPTPVDSGPVQDAGAVAVRASGLGRDVFLNARWSGGVAAEAELPARITAAANLYARDGFPIPYFEVASTGDPTGGSKNVLVAPHLDTYRLPAVVLLDGRLARVFPLTGGSLRVTVDVFNLLNRSTALQVTRDVELPSLGRASEILRPRIVRLGLDYRF